jgi:hypothetical protein
MGLYWDYWVTPITPAYDLLIAQAALTSHPQGGLTHSRPSDTSAEVTEKVFWVPSGMGL